MSGLEVYTQLTTTGTTRRYYHSLYHCRQAGTTLQRALITAIWRCASQRMQGPTHLSTNSPKALGISEIYSTAEIVIHGVYFVAVGGPCQVSAEVRAGLRTLESDIYTV